MQYNFISWFIHTNMYEFSYLSQFMLMAAFLSEWLSPSYLNWRCSCVKVIVIGSRIGYPCSTSERIFVTFTLCWYDNLGKSMNSVFLLPAVVKKLGRLSSNIDLRIKTDIKSTSSMSLYLSVSLFLSKAEHFLDE